MTQAVQGVGGASEASTVMGAQATQRALQHCPRLGGACVVTIYQKMDT